MVSKKDEIVWIVDDFPDEIDEIDLEGNSNLAVSDFTISDLPPSSGVGEIGSGPPNLPEELQESPALQDPVAVDSPPPLAPPFPESLGEPVSASSPPVQIEPTARPMPPPLATLPGSIDSVCLPRQMVRGERMDLNTFLLKEPKLTIELIGLSPASVKFLCLGLDADERLLGADYCVGPRQPSSPCGGVLYREKIDGGHSIVICPSSLPTHLARLEVVVVASTADSEVGNGATGVRIWNSVGAAESNDLASNCAASACATLAEVYKRQNQWRFRIIGEVFANSVDALLKKYGATRDPA